MNLSFQWNLLSIVYKNFRNFRKQIYETVCWMFVLKKNSIRTQIKLIAFYSIRTRGDDLKRPSCKIALNWKTRKFLLPKSWKKKITIYTYMKRVHSTIVSFWTRKNKVAKIKSSSWEYFNVVHRVKNRHYFEISKSSSICILH